MSKVIKNLEDVVGKERIDEITDKDWKVTELPSDEQLSEEKSSSPKARNNKNSRKNLAQYNKRTKDQKKKAVENLKVTEIQEDVDPREIFGGKVSIATLETIELIMPARSILIDRQEQLVYYNTINLFLKDFTADELSFSDIDDIVTLAVNKVLEQRLLSASKKAPKMVLEISTALEKFRKHSDKIKHNLASRRVDRIDLKNKPSMSIVELAAHLDAKKALDFEERLETLKKEAEDFVPPPRDDKGFLIEE